MIIDVHTHPPRHREGKKSTDAAPPWRPDKTVSLPSTWKEYEDSVLSVADYAFAFSIATYPSVPEDLKGQYDVFGPAEEINNAVAEFAHEHEGRVIGFMSVHPDDPNALNEMERAKGLGLRGLKLGLNYQRGELLGDNAYAVYRKAEQMGLPLLFHMGTSPVQFAPIHESYPLYVDRIAIAFPKLRIIMAHIGHPWQVDTCVVIRKHPNVYADISAQFFRPWSMYNALRLATEWGVLYKLLFGSDYPVATPQETMDGTRRVNEILEGTKLPRVPEDEIEKTITRDAIALLGLDR